MPSSAWIAWRHASHDVTCLCHPSLLIQVRQIRARQRLRALPSRPPRAPARPARASRVLRFRALEASLGALT